MIGQQFVPTRAAKVRVVDKTQFQNSKLVFLITSLRSTPIDSKQYSQRKEIHFWIMLLRENEIFTQQKDTFKHNRNYTNQK